jgi:GTPase SAR1 family protein
MVLGDEKAGKSELINVCMGEQFNSGIPEPETKTILIEERGI